jgi:hypothetical protein
VDAFWCITLSIIILRWWWRRNQPVEDIKNTKNNIDETVSVIIPTINSG